MWWNYTVYFSNIESTLHFWKTPVFNDVPIVSYFRLQFIQDFSVYVHDTGFWSFLRTSSFSFGSRKHWFVSESEFEDVLLLFFWKELCVKIWYNFFPKYLLMFIGKIIPPGVFLSYKIFKNKFSFLIDTRLPSYIYSFCIFYWIVFKESIHSSITHDYIGIGYDSLIFFNSHRVTMVFLFHF